MRPGISMHVMWQEMSGAQVCRRMNDLGHDISASRRHTIHLPMLSHKRRIQAMIQNCHELMAIRLRAVYHSATMPIYVNLMRSGFILKWSPTSSFSCICRYARCPELTYLHRCSPGTHIPYIKGISGKAGTGRSARPSSKDDLKN
jgi:hypothetical protein